MTTPRSRVRLAERRGERAVRRGNRLGARVRRHGMATDEVQAGRRTLARAAASAAERSGDRVAMRHREDGGWRERTFAEVGELVDELDLRLIALWLNAGGRG